jgi:hypothetical protein
MAMPPVPNISHALGSIVPCMGQAAALLLVCASLLPAAEPIVELTNHQSGISLSLSGRNGVDWAVEQTCHEARIADLVLHVKSSVAFSLAHNERNTLVNTNAKERTLGDTPDAGNIHWKIDRDQLTHPYVTPPHDVAPRFTAPFTFADLTYDGTLKVTGTLGDNGGEWGSSPRANSKRWYHGMADAAGNEWHVLTYWDDDIAALSARDIPVHRQGASDGHCVAVCVDPKTPVIQFAADPGGQFYTSPAKTYHVPRIWERTTWLTDKVRLHFVNLRDVQAVQFRVDDQPWQTYAGEPLDVSRLFKGEDRTFVLEARCGEQGPAVRRRIVFKPAHPAPQERHGRLLWTDENDRARVTAKLTTTAPFQQAYARLRKDVLQRGPEDFGTLRGGWRSGADSASASLTEAFVAAIDGYATSAAPALSAKVRLLRLSRLQPVGAEIDINQHSPGKDYLNELGQTLQLYTDAAVAYDLLADGFRSTDHADGMTPVEELIIREGLAKIAHTILGRMWTSYNANIGGGDTHWSHAYDFTIGTIALAMPTYSTPWYGVSGADRVTRNDYPDKWNPFPEQAVTWWEAVTNPLVATPGHPGITHPFRAEFLLSDDGWWTGPNDFVGDGDRYVGKKLVDVNHGGLANAECRIEPTELHGYEAPFTLRYGAWLAMRRIAGDPAPLPPSGLAYLRRRLVHGTVQMHWDAEAKVYSAGTPSVATGLPGFNRHFNFAALPQTRARVAEHLARLSANDADLRGLADPYVLALCAAPDDLPEVKELPLQRPVLKALMKHVVKPGERIQKDVVAIGLNGEELTIAVQGLPRGATWDSTTRRIAWTPGEADLGVHIVTVSASNGTFTTPRPFPIIVMPEPGKRPEIRESPKAFNAVLGAVGDAVELSWEAPDNPERVHSYLLYRDGVFFAAVPPGTTTLTDREYVLPSTHTRYHVSFLTLDGQESAAAHANGGRYLTVPAK